MTFIQKLEFLQEKNNSLLCIGLDPVLEKLPAHFQEDINPFFNFNKAIIDATHNLVCAYKPNSAFYEALGERGVGELKATCDYVRIMYPKIPIILDAKRGDLQETNKGYEQFAFSYLQADAITLSPYVGQEALQPFLDRKDKGCIILCRTSNPGAHEFQDLRIDKEPLYMQVAKQVKSHWNTHENCLLVVGATYPDEIAQVRKIVGNIPLLVPGIGQQGGEVGKSVLSGLRKDKKGLILSASRSILFASHHKDFVKKARFQAEKLRNEINEYRK